MGIKELVSSENLMTIDRICAASKETIEAIGGVQNQSQQVDSQSKL